ncbi:MAG TPA: DUF2069 domain-containing protein [Steroidobacteraceae bacterium]|nr:DUF2069 domain-containing protein [Steroidobacteraceae bacterium]
MPEHARTFALGLLCTLLALSVIAVVRESQGPAGVLLLGGFLVVPALLPLRGVVRRERRVYAWATLCIAPHFVYALTELVANPALRGVAVAMLFTGLALVVALVAYLRLTRPR